MPKQKIFMCFDGTWANKDYQSFVYNFLTAKDSTIAQLYSESQLIEKKSKFYYPGPGTDENGIGIKNWVAGVSGDTGKYSVTENVNRAYNKISNKLTHLKYGEKLDLQCIGWSRGGVTVDRLMSRLHRDLNPELKNKLDIILCNKIDPVPGGFFDRGDKVRGLKILKHSDEFTRKVFSYTYYSDTGALNATSLLKDNFSALYDINCQSMQYAFPANHEKIAGIEDDTGSSEIIKDHIKSTARYHEIQNKYSTEYTKSYKKISFPQSICNRGFLRPDESDHYRYNRIIGAPGLTKDMLKELTTPQGCVQEIEKFKQSTFSEEQQDKISGQLMMTAINYIKNNMSSRANRKHNILGFMAEYCKDKDTVTKDVAKKIIGATLQRRSWGRGETASGQALVSYLNSDGGQLKRALFPNKTDNVEYSDLRTFCEKSNDALVSKNKSNLYAMYSMDNVIDKDAVNKQLSNPNSSPS